MGKIEANFEILPSMAGEIKYYQRPCPHGVKLFNEVPMVGSTFCQMCPNYEGSEEMRDIDDNLVEFVDCKHIDA